MCGWHVPDRSEGRGWPLDHALRFDQGRATLPHPRISLQKSPTLWLTPTSELTSRFLSTPGRNPLDERWIHGWPTIIRWYFGTSQLSHTFAGIDGGRCDRAIWHLAGNAADDDTMNNYMSPCCRYEQSLIAFPEQPKSCSYGLLDTP